MRDVVVNKCMAMRCQSSVVIEAEESYILGLHAYFYTIVFFESSNSESFILSSLKTSCVAILSSGKIGQEVIPQSLHHGTRRYRGALDLSIPRPDRLDYDERFLFIPLLRTFLI